MKTRYPLAVLLLSMLSACIYSDGPQGRYLYLDLPVESSHTVHKTVQVNAAPGTTVIYNDSTPLDGYYYPRLDNGRRTVLRQAADNACLSLDIGSVPPRLSSQPCHGRNNQQFTFNRQRLSVNGLCLEAAGEGDPVAAARCRNDRSQLWWADGDHIRSADNGLCLESSGGVISLQRCDSRITQRFYR